MVWNIIFAFTLNNIKISWLEFLGEYDFDIIHIKEKWKMVVDALSRKFFEMHATKKNRYNSNLEERFLGLQI